MAMEVLGRIDLHGKLVSADALHTVTATAEFIHTAGGEFVLPVKENRKALFDALDALPWDQVPVAHSATDRGHGHLATWVGQQHEGNRNDGLFWAACRAAEASDETVLAELAAAARSAGLADREIATTINSARRTAGRSPEHHDGREATS
jgi:hypothetical protein